MTEEEIGAMAALNAAMAVLNSAMAAGNAAMAALNAAMAAENYAGKFLLSLLLPPSGAYRCRLDKTQGVVRYAHLPWAGSSLPLRGAR